MANEVTIHVKAKDDASKQMAKVQGSAKGMGIGVAAAAATAGAALLKFGADSVKAAQESIKVHNQTIAVLKSTGHAAKVTGADVEKLATAISNKTGIDDEAIQSGENLLLTFTRIRNETGKGNDVFNQATQTITDLSVAMGQDMKTSAVQVGKALNDPIKGMTALSRIGVTFTEQQKKQIVALEKSGHHLEAQKIILGELKKEFGGSAKAAATWADKAKVAFGNIQEAVGKALLPSLNRAAKWFVNHEDDVQGFATNVGDAAKEVGDFVSAIDKLGKRGGGLDKLMRSNKTGLKMGGGLSEATDEFVLWKAKILGGLADVAEAWGKINPRIRKIAPELRRMADAADKELGKVERRFNEARNVLIKKEWKAKIKADKHDLEAKYRASKQRLDWLKKQKPTPQVKADIKRAEEAFRKVKYQMQQIDALVARPKIKPTYSGLNAKNAGAPFYAAGGNIGGLGAGHAAEGGPRSSQTWVGEHGPELVDLPVGSHVNSNPDSMRIAGQRGGGGQSVTFNFNGPVYGGHDALVRALVDLKRRGQLDVVLR